MTTAKFTSLNTTALFLGSVAALLAGASTASFAAETSAPNASPVISAPFSPATRSVKVSYRDLNLRHPRRQPRTAGAHQRRRAQGVRGGQYSRAR